MDSEELLALMKSHSEAWLVAYKTGYEKGFSDACDKALAIFNKPKREYRKEKAE